jgi:hypothetical protein
MIDWHRLPSWTFRAWPVLAMVPVALAHWVAFHLFPNTAMVNKLVGMTLQILGGLLVLYSINDNLGIFRAQSLSSAVIAWFKDFPLVHEPNPVTIQAKGIGSATACGSLSVNHTLSTVEERIAELERLTQDLQQQLDQKVHAIDIRIEAARSEFQQQIAHTSRKVTDISRQLEHAAVGGFKFQALGVFLVIYGAFTGVFA